MYFGKFAAQGFFVTVLSVFASVSTTACVVDQGDVAVQSVERAEELRSRSAHFETFTGADGDVYFHLVAANGQITLRSEGYTRISSAKVGMEAVLVVGSDESRYDIRQAKNGDWYFNLRATNGKIVGTSQLYSTKSNATRATRTVRALIGLISYPVGFSSAPTRERFETFLGEDGQTYFHLRAGNGEIVLSSEGYTRKSSALNGIDSVETNGVNESRFQIFETGDGDYAFHLQAPNGEIIGRGESYSSRANANRAVNNISAMLRRGVTIAL